MNQVFALLTVFATLTSCAVLQPAKKPAQELWYAAGLLCAQDLEQYAEVQEIHGAVQLIQVVCSSVEVAKPYLDVLLKQDRSAGLQDLTGPLEKPRANAVAQFKARMARQ